MTMPDTTTDRELLDLAAKAAGIELTDFHGVLVIPDPDAGCPPWNSLTDDGDAFRLAVALQFTVAIRPHEVEVFDEGGCLVSEPIFMADSAFIADGQASDPNAVARLAVTRAAAQVQREREAG